MKLVEIREVIPPFAYIGTRFAQEVRPVNVIRSQRTIFLYYYCRLHHVQNTMELVCGNDGVSGDTDPSYYKYVISHEQYDDFSFT